MVPRRRRRRFEDRRRDHRVDAIVTHEPGGDRLDRFDLRADKPAGQVEEVHAMLDEDSPRARRVPEPMPGRQAVIGRVVLEREPADRPEHALAPGFHGQQPVEDQHERGEPEHVIDGNDAVVGASRVSDAATAGDVDRQGLLDEDVASGVERLDGEIGVGPRRCGDHDDIDTETLTTGCRGRSQDERPVSGRRAAGPVRGLCPRLPRAARRPRRPPPGRRTCRTSRIRRARSGGRGGRLSPRCSLELGHADARVGHAVEDELPVADRRDRGGEHDVGHGADLLGRGLWLAAVARRCGRGPATDRPDRAARHRRNRPPSSARSDRSRQVDLAARRHGG